MSAAREKKKEEARMWALGKMGDAPTREAACAAAEAEITRAILRALRW